MLVLDLLQDLDGDPVLVDSVLPEQPGAALRGIDDDVELPLPTPHALQEIDLGAAVIFQLFRDDSEACRHDPSTRGRCSRAAGKGRELGILYSYELVV
jgi:hypothetical protein